MEPLLSSLVTENESPRALLAQLLDGVCTVINRQAPALFGTPVRPYTDAALDQFATYPPAVQRMILDGVRGYARNLLDIVSSGTALDNTAQALWRVFRSQNLRPTADLLGLIEPNDVVEIYLPNHVQCYRSLNYFQYTSYTLGELVVYPWLELIDHDYDYQSLFMGIAESIFVGQTKATVAPALPATRARERFSPRRYEAQLHFKGLSPLADHSGQNIAAVIIWKMQLLGEQTAPLYT